MLALILASLAVFVGHAVADTPANCSYDDIVGTWTFYEGDRGHSSDLDCKHVTVDDLNHQTRVQLSFPNKASDQYGHEGTWTIIYNQGFEAIINGRHYFAFSNFTVSRDGVVSHCQQTDPGWSHDIYVRDWACYIGQKEGGPVTKMHFDRLSGESGEKWRAQLESRKFRNNRGMIERINRIQKSWTAREYPELEKYTLMDMLGRKGGIKSRVFGRPKPAPVTAETRALAEELPASFDWRNVNGKNYISPVRDQGGCGSCYAFATMGGVEARYAVWSDNAEQYIFSPQDIVEWSEYAQGCEGGFPYLIEKHAEDFGVVTESCNPYKNPEPSAFPKCTTDPACRRYYATDYQYIGGYYGATNEPLMRLSLVNNGPVVVGFEALDDLVAYQGGIYSHTDQADQLNRVNGWNPFELVNHAVLIVGYGTDEASNTPYWIVKNSWGADWGEDGYFRIVRGTDECGIESLATEFTPLPTY